MKKKFRKWLLGLCMAILVSFAGTGRAYATEVKEINVEGYALDENQMRIYINTDAQTIPNKENLKIFLGDGEYKAQKVSAFDSSQEGVSYLVLVDVSGSVTEADIEAAKGILTQLVELKKDKDNLAIIEIKNEIAPTEFASEKEALLEQIQNIQRTKEDTNLYLAVREGLKLLDEEEVCYQKKCMIILSDGMDDQKNGILFEDVRDSIKNGNIPVCTLAMPVNGTTKGEEAPDKVLKSFTDNAAGGVHIRMEDTEMANEEIAKALSDFAHGGVVAEISLEGFESNGSNVELNVEMETEAENIQGDSCTISSYEIAAVLVEEVEVTEPEVVEEPVEEDSTDIYPWGIIAGVVVLSVVAIIFLGKKKSEANAEKEKENDISTDVIGEEKVEGKETAKEEKKKEKKHQKQNVEDTEAIEEEDAAYMPEPIEVIPVVSLTEIGLNAHRILQKECRDTITIGRRKNADIVIRDDMQVSGYHCELSREAGNMYVRDLESTNGTYLNGVPVQGKVQISQDDVLFIGSYEYRISWE